MVQTVRNVESALIAHLGMRVSHKKISVATSDDGRAPEYCNLLQSLQLPTSSTSETNRNAPSPKAEEVVPVQVATTARRRIVKFEDVEVRRSRTKGVACRVTLRKGDQSFIGEAEGMENERLRIELAGPRHPGGHPTGRGGWSGCWRWRGCKVIEAFDHEFVFVGVTTRTGRESVLMTGSAEVRESPETSSVLAVLDVRRTGGWIGIGDRRAAVAEEVVASGAVVFRHVRS